ncbi:hypothetical protein ABIB50_000936 [Mucilaginibacter sp. UYCu711]
MIAIAKGLDVEGVAKLFHRVLLDHCISAVNLKLFHNVSFKSETLQLIL